jgi:hypothetical protein
VVQRAKKPREAMLEIFRNYAAQQHFPKISVNSGNSASQCAHPDSQATNCSVLSLPFQERAGRAKSEVLLDLPSQVTYEYRANRCGIPWAICSAPRRLFLSRQLSHQGM